jgi:hypothetical protein
LTPTEQVPKEVNKRSQLWGMWLSSFFSLVLSKLYISARMEIIDCHSVMFFAANFGVTGADVP